MALAYARYTSAILSGKKVAAGASVISNRHDLGATTLIQGLWVHTTIGSSGLEAAPSKHNAQLIVNVYPLTAASGTQCNLEPRFRFSHHLTGDAAHAWSDYCECLGGMPRYLQVGVTNGADQAVYTGALTVTLEGVKTTS